MLLRIIGLPSSVMSLGETSRLPGRAIPAARLVAANQHSASLGEVFPAAGIHWYFTLDPRLGRRDQLYPRGG